MEYALAETKPRMSVQRPDLQAQILTKNPSSDRNVLAKGERETGSNGPSTKRSVQFTYRLG
jgi:hypothetical protein